MKDFEKYWNHRNIKLMLNDSWVKLIIKKECSHLKTRKEKTIMKRLILEYWLARYFELTKEIKYNDILVQWQEEKRKWSFID